MNCSHCGICCEKTEMLLSRADILLLERAGYAREKFVRFNKEGFAQLRNSRGFCVFYQTGKHLCDVYRHRPLGCRIYPVIYSEEEGIIVDDLCPQAGTVSKKEIKSKAKELRRLLQRIDCEKRKPNVPV
jgi:Fe-S-cluster containining protein